jgi:alpha/beta superfamily hydrolase
MMNEEKIIIPVSGIEHIEGVMSYPDVIVDGRAAFLCSPHPHFAGNMENNIIKALYEFLSSRGLPVMKYNYRGVGGSMIRLPEETSIFDYWNDVEENKKYEKTIEDTEACLKYLNKSLPGVKITMIGYSFGAIMAMLAMWNHPEIERVIGIAPPLSEYDFSRVVSSDKKTYLIGSSGDFVYDRDEFITFCEGMDTLNDYAFFEDCDHFFRGREDELSAAVWKFMEDDDK